MASLIGKRCIIKATHYKGPKSSKYSQQQHQSQSRPENNAWILLDNISTGLKYSTKWYHKAIVVIGPLTALTFFPSSIPQLVGSRRRPAILHHSSGMSSRSARREIIRCIPPKCSVSSVLVRPGRAVATSAHDNLKGRIILIVPRFAPCSSNISSSSSSVFDPESDISQSRRAEGSSTGAKLGIDGLAGPGSESAEPETAAAAADAEAKEDPALGG